MRNYPINKPLYYMACNKKVEIIFNYFKNNT